VNTSLLLAHTARQSTRVRSGWGVPRTSNLGFARGLKS